jgi:hypothetical protein
LHAIARRNSPTCRLRFTSPFNFVQINPVFCWEIEKGYRNQTAEGYDRAERLSKLRYCRRLPSTPTQLFLTHLDD